MFMVIAVTLVVFLFAGAALASGLDGLNSSEKARDVARAQAAADAGADIAGWRMNRTLVAPGTGALLGYPTATLRTLTCVSVGVGGGSFSLSLVSAGTAFCPQTTDESLGDGSSFHYTVSTGVNVTGLNLVIARRVIAVGTYKSTTRRVLVTYRLDIDPSHPTTLFKRWRYVQCTSKQTGSAVDSGCPDPGY
jgi:hypothetical protein